MVIGGIFLSLTRPSSSQQKSFITAASTSPFNYDPKFLTASSSSSSSPSSSTDQTLTDGGFSINRYRLLLGSGPTTFRLARSALLSWRHVALPWAFVDPQTPVRSGSRFCICFRELLPLWILLPLRIAYVRDDSTRRRRVGGASFSFGSGTLRGHLLAGEERFSVEWDENNQVWYEIFSFSKPAHLLSYLAYPYVKFRQRVFAQQSGQALVKHITDLQSTG